MTRLPVFGIMPLVCVLFGGCSNTGHKEPPSSVSCEWNLEMLAKAISAYEADHGSCPSFTVDDGGNKVSWRILIAPYVLMSYDSAPSLLEAFDYRFDESWNSPHNKAALSRIPLDAYYCPTCENAFKKNTYTSYVMLARPTAGRGQQQSLPPNAVVVVESANCEIGIAEPRDVSWDSLWEGESPYGKGKLNSMHPKVVKGIRVDGTVIDIPKGLDGRKLKMLLNGEL